MEVVSASNIVSLEAQKSNNNLRFAINCFFMPHDLMRGQKRSYVCKQM